MWRGFWSTGRELNPRILVLQTSALATSPPVLILLLESGSSETTYKGKTHLSRGAGGLGFDSGLLEDDAYALPAARPQQQ